MAANIAAFDLEGILYSANEGVVGLQTHQLVSPRLRRRSRWKATLRYSLSVDIYQTIF